VSQKTCDYIFEDKLN